MIDTNKYAKMLHEITPKYLGGFFTIDNCPIPLVGENIKQHLNGCKSILICTATLGEEFDRLLRKLQITDMTGAVILDSLAGEYLEKFCDKKDFSLVQNAECVLSAEIGMQKLIRFSPGYGDFPLSVNRSIIAALNASTRIGIHITESLVLTPQKSITGIIGIV